MSDARLLASGTSEGRIPSAEAFVVFSKTFIGSKGEADFPVGRRMVGSMSLGGPSQTL